MVQNLERSVKFSVYDHDIIGKNTLLGTAVLDPEALYDPNGHPSDPPRRVDLPLSSIEYGDRGTLQVTIKILDLGLNLNAEEEEEEGEASEEEDWGGEAEDETMAEREEQAPAEAPPAPEAKDLVELLEEKWTEEEALCPKSAPGTKASSDGSLPGKVTLTPQKISKPSSARDSPKSVKRESSLFSADDVQAALKDDPGTPTGGADVAPSQPHVKRTLSRGLSRQMSSLGTFKGRAMTRGGWMRTAFKERYVVLANDQLIVYKVSFPLSLPLLSISQVSVPAPRCVPGGWGHVVGPFMIVGPSLTDTWLLLPPFFPNSSQILPNRTPRAPRSSSPIASRVKWTSLAWAEQRKASRCTFRTVARFCSRCGWTLTRRGKG